MIFTLFGYANSVMVTDGKTSSLQEKSTELSQTEEILRVLYIAYFDRAPDVGGLNYWGTVHDKHLSDGMDSKSAFVKIANDFSKNSQAGTLNAQSDEDFVKSVYINQLGELGDREGIFFWKESLEGGLSRSEFMVNFVAEALSVTSEDITADKFPSFSDLELETAQKRVEFLDDKLRLSVSFTTIFGELSNPKDANNLDDDPSYRASQLLMREFKEKHDVEALERVMQRIKDDFSYQENPNGTEIMSALVAPFELESNFKKYKALWRSQNRKDYTYIYNKSCYCLPEENIEVIVDDYVVVDATYLPSQVNLTTEERGYVKTVDDYFTIIENAIEDKVARLEVSYNKRYGYPTSIYIDIDEMIADEEIGHYLTDLKISGEVSVSSVIEKMDISFREHGYAQFPSKVITSQDGLDRFLNQVTNDDNWNSKEEFLNQLDGIEIDFSSENILFYRMTEGSGSVQLSIQEPTLSPSENEILIEIKRDVPEIGTDDMAYYTLAYRVDKRIKKITFDNGTQEVIIENKSSDMVIPQNCQAWFDGCNSCGRDGDGLEVCTQMYCLVYRPQDFRCTAWE